MISATKRGILFGVLAVTAFHGFAHAQDLFLRVNLPAYRLDVYRGEERIRSYRTVIGSASYPTPMGTYELGFIEWNPWWHPPSSEWARDAVRTPPGPENPMGRAKIQFEGLLFIHGSQAELGRAVSHGCIRISNDDVLDLARLLARESGADIGAAEIDRLERSPSSTRRVSLPRKIRVQIVYHLAEEVDGEILVHEDVYGRGMTQTERELARRAGERLEDDP